MSVRVSRKPALSPSEYLDNAIAIFNQAAGRSCGVTSKRFRIAESIIQLEFADTAMIPLVARAFSHLEIPANDHPSQSADLTIHIWDSASTATPSLPGWSVDEWGMHLEIPRYNNHRFFAAVQLEPKVLYMFDLERRLGLFWIENARELPPHETSAPMRPLLFEWLLRRGMLPVHGSAVGYRNGGVLLAGRGGAGKSNAALACLESDLLYASDDFCALSESDCWNVHGLYSTGKVAQEDIVRIPYLRSMISNPDQLERDKAIFFLNEHRPERLISGFPLRAIVVVRVAGCPESRFEPASKVEVQKTLAMSTMPLAPLRAAVTFRSVARLARAMPCYELHMGSRSAEIPERIDELLRSLQ